MSEFGREETADGYRGVLEPAAGAFVKLSLATSQPVAFVDVRPGDRVEKGWQVVSHWESPERLYAMKNELDKAKKQLELAKIRASTADQPLGRLEKLGANQATQSVSVDGGEGEWTDFNGIVRLQAPFDTLAVALQITSLRGETLPEMDIVFDAEGNVIAQIAAGARRRSWRGASCADRRGGRGRRPAVRRAPRKRRRSKRPTRCWRATGPAGV